jgi:hypothetical protein
MVMGNENGNAPSLDADGYTVLECFALYWPLPSVSGM